MLMMSGVAHSNHPSVVTSNRPVLHSRRRRHGTTAMAFGRRSGFLCLLAAICGIVVFRTLYTTVDAVLQPIVRINAGGEAFTDTKGNVWRSDTYYESGGTMGEYKVTAGAIRNTLDPALYQTEHYWRRSKAGPYLYQIPVPNNGKYMVELHFAELDPARNKIGRRVFNILVQGLLVFPKFDIFARANGTSAALVVSSVAFVTNKIVSIEFRGVQFNPTISAIAIFWDGKKPIAPSRLISIKPVVSPTFAPVQSSNASMGPVPSPAATAFKPVLINTGGGPYVDIAGKTWKGDTDANFFSGGQIANVPLSLAGTLDDVLYHTERNGAFTYEIPLPEGDFEVKLHFAELYAANSKTGARVFDVLVEQSPTFTGVDIFSLVGSGKALTLEAAVAVVDGALSLSFSGTIGSAQLSAIEINLVGDHLAHAVAGGPYAAVDVIGRGYVIVQVDSTPSHTHGTGLSLVSWTWYDGSTVAGTGEISALNLTVGEHYITLRVADDGGNESSETTTVTIFPQGFPAIVSLTPTSGYVNGGNPIVLNGYGFNYLSSEIVVRIGKQTLTGPTQIVVVDVNTIQVLSVPPSTSGIPVAVTVTTPKGVSNTVVYKYVKGSPIDWTRGVLYDIPLPTTVAFGPDSKLYVGTSDGKIAKITLSGSNKVVSAVVSTAIGNGRAILGMAFDPLSAILENPPVYVSHSLTFHGEKNSSSGGAINGKVSVVSGANLDKVSDVITGLPVSDHDHAVNGLEFGDAGELYILVGGNTNGGIPGALSGSQLQKESILSSACLVAYLSDPSFNGFLTYDAPDNGNLNPGFGVEVFAAGLRNPFDLVLHSNLKLYATDNGPNMPYGDMSKTCVQGIPDVEEEDKLNLIVRGGYYGHANRKRGQVDARQCVWHSSGEASNAGYTAPLAILPASSDGIIEFQTDHFGKQIRGDLLISKYKGGLYRVILSSDGSAVSEAPYLFDDDGDLSIVQGPEGAIFSTKYKGGKIRYLIPLEPTSLTLVIKSVFPRRGGLAGGTTLRVFGERFDSSGSPMVSVGGNPCLVLGFSSVEISCNLPSGSGTVDIVVTTGVESATFLAGYRYISGLPASIPLIRVNVAGGAYKDSQGNVWEADSKNTYYAKGVGNKGSRGATTATISGSNDVALYQNYRVFHLGPPPYMYIMPVPSPGKYTVVLHFCEIDPSRANAGARVMDIWVEGKLFRSGFDIASVAGGAFIAVTLSATETVTDGFLTVELKSVIHNPIIAALEVYRVGKYP